MLTPRPSPLTLSVSLVLYCSDAGQVDATLNSLERAAVQAVDAGLLRAPVPVVVVDNQSPGDYRAAVQPIVEAGRGALQCHWLQASENGGFGAGHNLALREVTSDCHLVLNPDVELAPDALQAAMELLLDCPQIALIAPAARGSAGEVEHLCKRYPSVLVLLARASGLQWLQRLLDAQLARYEMRELVAASEPVDVPLASGCCMLARTAALHSVNGFDERFFMYFEDFDLSLRIAGQGRVVYNPAMQIVHHGGYTARKGWHHIRLFGRSAAKFFGRYGWHLL